MTLELNRYLKEINILEKMIKKTTVIQIHPKKSPPPQKKL